MQEKVLHYIWASRRYWHTHPLSTTSGQQLEIINTGIPSNYGGPDFSNAHIRLNGINFYGSIEIHAESRNWYTHQHNANNAYQNVILHVVWKDNKPATIDTTSGKLIPTLELCHFMDMNMVAQSQQMMQHHSPILCKGHLTSSHIRKKWATTIDVYLKKRLKRKSQQIIALWEKNGKKSDSTAYQLLAEHFGFKANNRFFLQLSQQISIKAIQANNRNLYAIEALLLGQAGFLDQAATTGDYHQKLILLHQKLQKKYKLPPPMRYDQWRFCGLRPPNFPTIRLAQLAQILTWHPAIFHFLLNINTQNMYEKLAIRQSSYWQSHYLFGQKSTTPIPGLGRGSIQSLVINTVVPLLVASGSLREENFYFERAVQILQALSSENNRITRHWGKQGIKCENALASQGAIELFQQLCSKKKCPYCPIGQAIVGKSLRP